LKKLIDTDPPQVKVITGEIVRMNMDPSIPGYFDSSIRLRTGRVWTDKELGLFRARGYNLPWGDESLFEKVRLKLKTLYEIGKVKWRYRTWP